MFVKLKSGTTYNYSVVAINMSNMEEVGDPVCARTFITRNGSDITGTIFNNTMDICTKMKVCSLHYKYSAQI